MARNRFPDGSVIVSGQTFSGITGTMAAGLAANASIMGVRFPAAATGSRFAIDWLHLHYACIGAFTNPVTAGRRIALRRASGGNPSGGTDLDVTPDVSDQDALIELPLTGQIANTGALTMTGVSFESGVRERMMLAHAGAAGNDYDELWKFSDFILKPGELAVLIAGAAFDAAGTWELTIKGHGHRL